MHFDSHRSFSRMTVKYIQQTAVHTGYVLHAKDLHIIGLNNNRTIGLNLNVTILNSL